MTVAAIALAALIALIVTVKVERWAGRLGLVDVPNARSSHVIVRPRGGGLGVVAGAFAALLLVGLTQSVDAALLSVVLGATLVAAAGLWDDVAPLAPGARLVVQTTAAGIVVLVSGGLESLPLPPPLDVPLAPLLGVPLAIVWMVGVTNFFNFMDGADGLAGGQAVLTLGSVAFVLWPSTPAVVALAVVAATLAFLTRNWSPARIFLGDVGSGWLGFLMGGLPFTLLPGSREALVLLVAVSLTLFLTDPALTLFVRWSRGVRLTESHREHAYQRLFAPGESHGRVVRLVLAVSAILSLFAVLAWYQPRAAWPVLACAALATLGEWRVAGRRR